jgi:hypothetical protein
VQLARDNRERLKQAIIKMQELGLAGSITHDREGAAAWRDDPDSFLDALDSALATDAYLSA